MKKAIKSCLFLIIMLILLGCNKNLTAKDAVVEYLNGYINNDESIVNELNDYVDSEDFTDEQKELYKKILLKQYKTLTYNIVNETYDGDKATVVTRIRVIDLYTPQVEAVKYLNEASEKFYNSDNKYDKNLFLNYKLEKMNESTAMVEYNVNFKVMKNEQKKWEVVQLSNDDLEKIHGIYGFKE